MATTIFSVILIIAGVCAALAPVIAGMVAHHRTETARTTQGPSTIDARTEDREILRTAA